MGFSVHSLIAAVSINARIDVMDQERSCACETSYFIFGYTFAISLGKRGNRTGRGQVAEVIERADTSGAGTGVADGDAR